MALLRGFSSLGWHEATLADVENLARIHSMDAMELRALGGGVDLAAWLAQTYGDPEALAETRGPRAVPVCAVDSSFRLIGHTAADRLALLDLLPWAEAFGARWIRVFDGGAPAGVTSTEIENAQSTLAWWRDERAARGWRADLMVETHDALTTTAGVLALCSAVPGCAILWDTHHTWRKGGEDPLVTWAAIKAHVVHVHVKDSVSRPSARHPFTYVLPGEGEFPMAPLRERLSTDGYRGVVSLEWERLWHPYLPPLAEALRMAEERRWW